VKELKVKVAVSPGLIVQLRGAEQGLPPPVHVTPEAVTPRVPLRFWDTSLSM
jgi:hypothetical protein